VRKLDPAATDDDGTPIASSVFVGPFLTADFDELLLKDLIAILGNTSGSVQFDVFVGDTAELALASGSVVSGTWTANRNLLIYNRHLQGLIDPDDRVVPCVQVPELVEYFGLDTGAFPHRPAESDRPRYEHEQ
jgi:hypothetical protein